MPHSTVKLRPFDWTTVPSEAGQEGPLLAEALEVLEELVVVLPEELVLVLPEDWPAYGFV